MTERNCGACWQCVPEFPWMMLCTICGNKRCPHAYDHENGCTDSNAPGQPGSAYEDAPNSADPMTWPPVDQKANELSRLAAEEWPSMPYNQD
jgi:hypothetical protein